MIVENYICKSLQDIEGFKSRLKNYEQFVNKASFSKTDSGVLVAALSFRDEYNGHTLEATLEQIKRLTNKVPQRVKVDRL